jgi:hypothetical protein
LVLGVVLASWLSGCAGGSQADVSAKENEVFKHPANVDMIKVPPNAFSHKGPAFIGAPSGATRAGGTTPSRTTATGN